MLAGRVNTGMTYDGFSVIRGGGNAQVGACAVAAGAALHTRPDAASRHCVVIAEDELRLLLVVACRGAANFSAWQQALRMPTCSVQCILSWMSSNLLI